MPDNTPRFSMFSLMMAFFMFGLGYLAGHARLWQEERAKTLGEITGRMLYELEQHDPSASGWEIKRYENGKSGPGWYRGL